MTQSRAVAQMAVAQAPRGGREAHRHAEPRLRRRRPRRVGEVLSLLRRRAPDRAPPGAQVSRSGPRTWSLMSTRTRSGWPPCWAPPSPVTAMTSSGSTTLLVRIRGDQGLDVPLHVDAASGGFVWPFLYPDSEWDFRLEQVRSINVSGHKFGLVYPGVGWLIFRERADLAEDLVFYENYLGKTDATFTLNFSTGSAMVLAQYYNLIRYGREGYGYVMEMLQRKRPCAGSGVRRDRRLRADRGRGGAAAPGGLQARGGAELRRVRHRVAAVGRAGLDGARLHAAAQRRAREGNARAGEGDAHTGPRPHARRGHRPGVRDPAEKGRGSRVRAPADQDGYRLLGPPSRWPSCLGSG